DGIRVFHVTGVQTCALPIFQLLRLRFGLRGREGCRAARIRPCRRLRGLQLAFRPDDLQTPPVPALQRLLPGAPETPQHAHDGEDEPPEMAQPLEEGLHPAIVTARIRAV